MSRGRRVLNLFSYAGGFSLHAALGGASHVTSVDIDPYLVKAAEERLARSRMAREAPSGAKISAGRRGPYNRRPVCSTPASIHSTTSRRVWQISRPRYTCQRRHHGFD